MTDKDEEKSPGPAEEKAAAEKEAVDDAKPSEEPSSPLKEWGAAIGLMVALALSFYALISMFKRGLD